MANELLPIKVVFPTKTDYVRPVRTGRLFEPLRPVTPAFRRRLHNNVRNTRNAFAAAFKESTEIPAIASVTLRPDALAKSYRPSEIFNSVTAPIIGSRRNGELLVSVTERGLSQIDREIDGQTQRSVAHLSTIRRIAPYRPEISVEPKARVLRVRLARHPSSVANSAIDSGFEMLMEATGTRAVPLDYAPGLRIYRVEGLGESDLDRLKRFVGLQSITAFPEYGMVRSTAHILRAMADGDLHVPSPGVDYGTVGLIDSGTDPNNPALQSWVTHRLESWTPRAVQENSHGSFVAGLITNGRTLNHDDLRFPDSRARIVDVVAIDRDGAISEDDLLRVIDDALEKFPAVRVWNLSLGLADPGCSDTEVSELAAALDERSRRHGVLFVIASGNMRDALRTWPPQHGAVDDRVRPPADAIRALTVGGIAHLDTARTVVRREHPSPFSRGGLGAAGTMKPELGHYAGNVDAQGQYLQTGIISTDGRGRIAENVGTSFACPLVSSLAAAVQHELDVPGAASSPTLLKAMLLHSAFLRSGPSPAAEARCRGVGIPGSVADILSCAQSAATIVIQARVQPNKEFTKEPFPMPECLMSDNGLECEILMTMVHDCPVDRAFGVEYCRTNVVASLGTMGVDRRGKPRYTRQVGLAIDDARTLMKDDVFELGHRWSPVKHYYRNFQRGPNQRWRLKLSAVNRAEYLPEDDQDVVLLITIRSRNANAKVYNQLVRAMSQLSWTVSDLGVRSQIRERHR